MSFTLGWNFFTKCKHCEWKSNSCRLMSKGMGKHQIISTGGPETYESSKMLLIDTNQNY